MSRLKRLIVEIHERSLWQALVVYLGASFAVLEAVDLFIDHFALPRWLFPVAFAVLVAGLLLVAVIALAKEEVYGNKVQPEYAGAAAEEDRRLRLLTWRSSGLSFLVALAVWGVVATGWYLLYGGATRGPASDRKSVAVLPFANMSADPENEYFSDGITVDIINHLSKIADLTVISRTSIMQYKETTKNLRQIGDELGVATVVAGEVQRLGNRVRINAQLIDAATDAHLWAEQYDRQIDDVFEIQSEIASRIGEALQATLTAKEKEAMARKPTENLEAYEYYMKGRHQFYKYNREANARAIELFQQALLLDPEYAVAHAGLSVCQTQMRSMNWSEDDGWLDHGEEAARRALEIDQQLAEAHFALGFVYENREMYAEMESSLRAVLANNPNHAHAHDGLADVYYKFHGHLDEALAEFEIALRLDPFLAPAIIMKALVHIAKGQNREALRLSRKGSLIHPDLPVMYYGVAVSLAKQGHHEEAIAAYEAVLELNPVHVYASRGRALALIELGRISDARAEAERTLRLAPERNDSRATYHLTLGRIGLERGEIQAAVEHLSEAVELEHRTFSIFSFWRLGDAEMTLAAAYIADGQLSKGIAQYESLLEASPYLKSVHYELAQALQQAGATGRARAEYDSFVSAWQDADPELQPRVEAARRAIEALTPDA